MSEVTPIKCTSCQVEKNPSEFHRRGNKTQNICKSCRNEDARREYAERGKARKTQPPTPINLDNVPALMTRIEPLQTKLCAKASAFSHDALDADDIYSEMVEAILRKCKPEDTDAYILQCANWTAQAYVSKRTTYSNFVAELPMDEDEVEAAGFKIVEARTVEDTIVQREIFAQFEAVIKSLPVENQKVVAMLSVGMNQREIAKEMQVSEQTISERMKKIREQIAQSISPDIGLSFA